MDCVKMRRQLIVYRAIERGIYSGILAQLSLRPDLSNRVNFSLSDYVASRCDNYRKPRARVCKTNNRRPVESFSSRDQQTISSRWVAKDAAVGPLRCDVVEVERRVWSSLKDRWRRERQRSKDSRNRPRTQTQTSPIH